MTQTLFAHMNKRNKKSDGLRNKEIVGQEKTKLLES
jgi:hypothetical protein